MEGSVDHLFYGLRSMKSYASSGHKLVEYEIGDKVLLKVSSWKKCLVKDRLHVSLGGLKIDKTLRFVEEPVEIMDREVKSIKRSGISIVEVRWNSRRGPEFTWEREEYMKSKYPQLFVDRVDNQTSWISGRDSHKEGIL
ncbi:hypothetical protein Tco_1331926 [Tanacetum coccineum]